MAVYLIDGDNAPGTRTKGLQYLSGTDTVCICFAKTNKYYLNPEIVKQLKENTEAEVRFYRTETSKQAVDFLMAIKAEFYIQQRAEEVYLISGDNHITTIATILQNQHTNIKVSRAENIYDGYFSDLDRISDLNMAKNVLLELFDEEKGVQFYNKLESLLCTEITAKKPENFWQKMIKAWR